MSDWRPGEPLPPQVADAFADIYDWFHDGRYYVDAYNRGWGKEVDCDPATDEFLSLAVAGGLATPAALRDDLTPGRHRLSPSGDKGSDRNAAYAAFRTLSAIDRAVGPSHPLQQQLQEYARFNTDRTDGYVLPKVTKIAYRTRDLAECFENLVRAKVTRGEVRVLGRARSAYGARSLTPRNPKIVVAPFLYRCFDEEHGHADCRFVGLALDGEDRYFFVRHKERSLPLLEQRVRDIVQAIRQTDATVAVFPELALNQELITVLRGALRESDSEGAALELVIVGANVPVDAWDIESSDQRMKAWPGMNVVQVFNGGGGAITFPLGNNASWTWRQAKRHPYKMDTTAQSRYGLDICFAESHDRDEAIPFGQHVCAFEHGDVRYAVVICEDLNQVPRTIGLLSTLLCNVVIAIVMDGPVKDSGWAADRSRDLSNATGGYTVVVNSLLMPNLEKVREYEASKLEKEGRPVADPYPLGRKPVASWIGPQVRDQGRPTRRFACAAATPVDHGVESLISDVFEVRILDDDPSASV